MDTSAKLLWPSDLDRSVSTASLAAPAVPVLLLPRVSFAAAVACSSLLRLRFSGRLNEVSGSTLTALSFIRFGPWFYFALLVGGFWPMCSWL